MKKIDKLWIYLLVFFLLCAGIILLFSSTTSPFYPNNYGVDSAFFRFVGLMIRRGKTLYTEIWDNKGPVLFFLQAIGTLKGTKNAEVTLTFLMQILNLFLTILFLFCAKLAAKSENKISFFSILSIICGTMSFCFLMEGGNLCEEWSMPVIACSLYLLVKYAANIENQPLHPRHYAFIHGICLALVFFIRANNAITICAGLAVAAVYLIYRRKWQNLLKNILFGLLGAAVVSLPILIYFFTKHALNDMLYSILFYNLKYSAQRSYKVFTGTDFWTRYLPIISSIMIIIIHILRERRIRLLDCMMLIIVTVNALMFWRSNLFLHYFVVFIPAFLLTMLLYANFPKIPEMLIMISVLAFYTVGNIYLLPNLSVAAKSPDQFAFAASIPESEKDPAMVLYATPAVYLNSGLIPCSRYAAYHFVHFPVDPAMKEEFLEDMRTNKPYWIVYLSGYEEIITDVKEMLDADYEKIQEEYNFTYYHLKQR